MARDFAAVNLAIWQDVDFRGLPREAQHLYLVLWSDPGLNYCGVTDWRPGRIASRAAGWTAGEVQEAADCLEARRFLVIDPETEEVLIKSWIRFDGLIGHHIMAVSMAKAFATVSSNDIRGVIVHELGRLKDKEPDLAGWSKPKVMDVLDQPAVDPRSRVVPSDPFANPSPNPSPNGSPNPSVKGKATGGPNPSANPSLTPSPSPYSLLRPAEADPEEESKPDRFNEFWMIYPKKEAKKNARVRWEAAIKKTDPDVIIASAKRYAAELKRKNKLDYCKLPDGWLYQERWNDEIPDAPVDPEAWVNGGRERPIVQDPFDEYAIWNQR